MRTCAVPVVFSFETMCFQSCCPCLARNTECDDACGCRPPSEQLPGGCLNRAVGSRNALVLGRDVAEVDTWGMDCYTRKNIRDGEAVRWSR